MSRRPLSLHHLTLLDSSPLDLVRTAVAAGYDHVGIRVVSPDDGEPYGDLVADARVRREVREATADLPLGVLDVEAFWLRPETDVAALAPALAAAREIGATYVLSVGHDPEPARQVQSFAELARLAAAHDLQVAIEPITYCAVNDLRAALSIREQLAMDNVSVLLDALQFFRSGVPLAEVAAASPGAFRYAQIADAPRAAPVSLDARRHEAREARQVPGIGGLDLGAWLASLPPEIPVAVEVPSPHLRAMPSVEAAVLLRRAVETLLESTAHEKQPARD